MAIANASTQLEKHLDRRLEDEEEANEFGWDESVDEAMHSFEFYQDCIALSPKIFGKPGSYVQSDMQFAQKAVQDIRKLVTFKQEDRSSISDDIHMDIVTRFFVN